LAALKGSLEKGLKPSPVLVVLLLRLIIIVKPVKESGVACAIAGIQILVLA
jgi:hypothetical protein